MSTAYLRSLVERRATLTDAATGVLDKCAADGADPTTEQRAQLDKWNAQAKELDAEIATIEAQVRAGSNFAAVLDRLAGAEELAERRQASRRDAQAPEAPKSIGRAFVESDAFTGYQGGGSSRRFEVDDFLGLEARAAITTADLNLPPVSWAGPTVPSFTTPLLDVIGREVVASGSVEYITWSDATGAAVVAEGALKPEATLTMTPTPVSLETIAYWKAITRQALEDAPRIQSIVEGKLRQGLARELEEAAAVKLATITAGTGAGIEGIREAIGAVQGAGFSPNAIALNPGDYAAIDIAAWTASAAPGGVSGPGTFWGLRPVPVPSLPAGTMYVGDFAEGLTWFDRGKSAVYMSDSHADYFIRNQLLILAETRAAFAVTEPRAILNVATSSTPLAARSAK